MRSKDLVGLNVFRWCSHIYCLLALVIFRSKQLNGIDCYDVILNWAHKITLPISEGS